MAGRRVNGRSDEPLLALTTEKCQRTTRRPCSEVLLGFEECKPYFPKRKCDVTGTPVRTALTKPVDQKAARRGRDVTLVRHMEGPGGRRIDRRPVAVQLEARPGGAKGLEGRGAAGLLLAELLPAGRPARPGGEGVALFQDVRRGRSSPSVP